MSEITMTIIFLLASIVLIYLFIKIKNKYAKAGIGCLGAIIFIITLFWLYEIHTYFWAGTIFTRPEIYGKVYDKETKKPIGYCLISDSIIWDYMGWGSTMDTTLSDKDGNYKIPASFKIISPRLGTAESSIMGTAHKRAGYKITVWFPGYKKYEIETEGRKLISGRLDIYLERPKTAEEADKELDYIANIFPPWFSLDNKKTIEEMLKKRENAHYRDLWKVKNIYDTAVIEETTRLIKNYESYRNKIVKYYIESMKEYKEYPSHVEKCFDGITDVCKFGSVDKNLLLEIPCEFLINEGKKNICRKLKSE